MLVSSVKKLEGGLRMKGRYKKSYSFRPLISIITVVFNGEKYLEGTIQSVLSQKYDNIEYIIIDGGSTDGTLEIIKRYDAQIDYWISEKDKGLYDAMNKGIVCAKGDLVGLINADDWLESKIELIAKLFVEKQDIDIFHGNLKFYKSEFESSIVKPNVDFKRMEVFGMSYNHPTFYIHKRVYNDMKYDVNYKIVADYKFTMEALKRNYKFFYIDDVIVNMRDGGVSSEFLNRIKEGHFARRELGYGICFTYYSTFIRITMTLLSKLKQSLKKHILSRGTTNDF